MKQAKNTLRRQTRDRQSALGFRTKKALKKWQKKQRKLKRAENAEA